jgi:hypothetical protein
MVIRRDWRHVGKNNAFGLSKQWHEHQCGKNSALKRNRYRERPPADAAFTRALFRVSFNKAPSEKTKSFFREILLLCTYHAPPHKNAASESGNICDAKLPGVALRLQEFGAALAGM